jgi:hypothetical protein
LNFLLFPAIGEFLNYWLNFVCRSQLKNLFEIEPSSVRLVSAKLGTGVKELLDAVVQASQLFNFFLLQSSRVNITGTGT